MSEAATIERNPIPLHERIAVKAKDAATLMSCSRSTFFARVKAGIYPSPGPDGQLQTTKSPEPKPGARMVRL